MGGAAMTWLPYACYHFGFCIRLPALRLNHDHDSAVLGSAVDGSEERLCSRLLVRSKAGQTIAVSLMSPAGHMSLSPAT